MKSLYIFLLFFICTVFIPLPVRASIVPINASIDQYTPSKPYPSKAKTKLKKLKELKKTKKVQSNDTVGILIFILGCMMLLVGLGISIVAITDTLISIGLGVIVLGFVLMCLGDIIGNLGLMGLIFDLCDCLSVLL